MEQVFDLDAWDNAKEAVTRGRLFELGHVFYDGMPHYPTHPDFEVSLFRKHGDRVRGDGASSASCHLSFGGHTGTHIDALCHVSQNGCMCDGTPADNQRLLAGEDPGDAEALAPVVRRGVLFDFAAMDGVERLDGDRVLTGADFDAACDRQGVTLQEGDVALLRTGWAQHWETEAYIAHETPGPDLDGGLWLADHGAHLVGSDTAVFEKGPVTQAAPVHRLMLFERNIHILENLNLEALAAAEIYSFLFVAMPLRIRGGTASPLRPVAIC